MSLCDIGLSHRIDIMEKAATRKFYYIKYMRIE